VQFGQLEEVLSNKAIFFYAITCPLNNNFATKFLTLGLVGIVSSTKIDFLVMLSSWV
jgi:hypothetical protein